MRGAPERAARLSMATGRELFLLKADIDEADERLRALRGSAVDQPPPETALAAALAPVVPSAPRRFHPPMRGTFRWVIPVELADGSNVVMLVNRIRHPDLVRGLEVQATITAQLGFEDPYIARPIAVDESCERLATEFAVFTRLEGTRLADMDDDEDAMRSGLTSAAWYLKGIHDHELPGAGLLAVDGDSWDNPRGRFASWGAYLRCRMADHIARCASEGAIDAAEAGRIRRILDDELGMDAEPADRLLHGDPGPDNIIMGANGKVLAMTDWEDALVGDPLFDVASFAAFQPERRWPAIFAGYFPGGRLPEESTRAFWLYSLRLALARTVMRARFAVHDKPGRAPAAGRIRRALAMLEGRDA